MEATEWDGARGEKWASNAEPLEQMLSPVDAVLTGALALKAPGRIADIGCGGGRTSRAVLEAAPAGSEVVGVDISPALVDLARSRVPAEDEGRISFSLANAGEAQPPGGPFDHLVSRFGVMFFDDPEAAFANLLEWLRPGGSFAFAVWASPRDNPWMTSVKDAVSTVADWPKPDPDAPGPFRYADGDAFADLLTRAGFEAVMFNDWEGHLAVGGGLPPDEAAGFAFQAFSVGDLLDDVDQDARDQAFRHLAHRYGTWADDGTVRTPARVHLVTGRRAVS